MKNAVTVTPNFYACHRCPAHRYPNAADRRQFIDRLLDKLLAAAIAVAVGVILVFLFTL